MADITVRVAGKGSVTGEQVVRDPATVAACDVCGGQADLVVSMGAVWACKPCIRARLDATSVAAWQLRDAGGPGLPWGTNAG
jgi:hypothetical protein